LKAKDLEKEGILHRGRRGHREEKKERLRVRRDSESEEIQRLRNFKEFGNGKRSGKRHGESALSTN
jgi:hypothetical protein